MKRFIAKRFATMAQGLILDTEALEKYDDVIDLSIGDPDLTTDSLLIDAAMTDAKAGYTRYGDPRGDVMLRRAVCSDWKRRYGQSIDTQQVFISCSAGLAMLMCLQALLDPGDRVLVLSPHYPEYSGQIALAGGKEVGIALSPEDGYAITAEKLEAGWAAAGGAKALIFNNPVNPSGVHYGTDTLRVLADFAISHGVVILADEIYTDMTWDRPFVSVRTLPGMEKYAVSINSFSKNYLMTGWRVGYIVADAELMDTLLTLSDLLTYTAPSISQRAALKALENAEQLEAKYMPVFRRRVETGAAILQAVPYVDMPKPQGTFYLFPSIRRSGLSSAEFCRMLLDEKHILATPGSLFGSGGEGSVRFACTVSEEKLAEALQRLL